MPKSLVTGAAGFIGSHLVDALLDAGHEVDAVDDLSGGFRENLYTDHDRERLDVYVGSITDHRFIESITDDREHDYIFHLAAYAAEGLSHFIRRHNYEVNLLGSVNLINAAVKAGSVKRFIFTSSAGVYSDGVDMPAPIDPYGNAKRAVEIDLQCAFEMFGLQYSVFRPHNVYGPRQNLTDAHRNVVGILMNQALRGKPFSIFGDGSQRRQFTYVSDVVDRLVDATGWDDRGPGIYDVGPEEGYTINQLADALAKVIGSPFLSREYMPARHEVHSLHIPSSFPTIPCVPLEEGLRRMWEWAKREGPREPVYFNDGHYELTKNIPPSWLRKAP